MRTILLPLLLAAVCLASIASAKPPRKPNLVQFTALIKYSPFTIRADPALKIAPSPLERDWMLGGISPSGKMDGPVKGRYFVTLINKKDRKDRIRFLPGFSAGEYHLLEVSQDSQSYKNSRVRIRKGSQTAWITYDEKLIKARPSAARKAPASKTKVSTSRGGPSVPGRSGSSRRTPRPRTVPQPGR